MGNKKNSRTRETNIRRKDTCSEIKKLTCNDAHALQEKYKNILGCRQLTIMLERCSMSRIVSHPYCLQVSSKNSVNNICDANDTRKLVHSTNHVSHQSPCVEKKNLESVHNFQVETAAKKINYRSSKFSTTTNVSENVSQISTAHLKRDASSKHKSIQYINQSDSTSNLDEVTGGHLQKNNLNESVAKPQECNTKRAADDAIRPCKRRKIYISTDSSSSEADTDFSVNDTLTTDNRNKEVFSSSYDNNSNAMNVAHNSSHLRKDNLNESTAKPQECNTSTTADDTVKPRKRTNIYTRRTDSASTEADTVDISKTGFAVNKELNVRTLQKKLIELQKKLISPRSNKLSKHTKKNTVAHTQKSTMMEDTKDKLSTSNRNCINSSTDTVQFSEEFIVPSSNKFSKLTKKRIVAYTQKNTVTDNTEETLCISTRSSIHSSASTGQYSERFIVPSSNELSKHTKKRSVAHTRKSTTKEDTDDTLSASTRNFSNFSTNTVQSSGTSVMSHSNELNKQTKESTVVNIEKSIKVKDKISEENNVEHDALHRQYEQPCLRSQKRLRSESSSSRQDVKRVKLDRTNWHRRLAAVNTSVDTSKEVDKTEKVVELKNHEKIPQLIRTDVPRPSVEFSEGDNVTNGVQVAQSKNEEQGVSSMERQTLIENFGYSNRVECNAREDARFSQQKAATGHRIPVSEDTSSSSESRHFNNSVSQGDEDDCISLFADSMLIEEYDVPETPKSRRSKEAPLVTEKQYTMTNKVIDNYYKKNALEFNEAYNVNYFNNSNTQIVPQRKKPVEIVLQREKPVEIVLRREKPVEIVLQREKPVEIVQQREKPVEVVPQREKPVEIDQRTRKPIEIGQRTRKPIEIGQRTRKPVEKVPLMEVKVQPAKNDLIARLSLNPQTNTRTVHKKNHNEPLNLLTLFRGFCYRMITTGVCYVNSCHFDHNFTPFLKLLYNRNETLFFEAMDNLIQQRHIIFLESFYKQLLRILYKDPDTSDFFCILKLLKKFCTSNIISSELVYDSIKGLIAWGVTVNQIVDKLVMIVDDSDTRFLTSISKILANYLASGDGWPTLKPLFMRIDKLDEDIVQLILVECILTQKHIEDVYENVVHKLDNETLRQFNKRLLLQFHSIRRQIQENLRLQEKVATTSVTIASPSPLNEPELIPYTVQTDNLSPKVWKDVCFDSNNNVQGGNSSALLHPIDNVPSPYSERSRDRFWKFYLDVHSLQEGLKHNDYRHVKKILDEAQSRHVSPFTRACYNVLHRTVEHSQSHLSKLASLAVQDGATATFFKILIDVTIYILADLAERELWVAALVLLNSMKGILHDSFLKFDAVVTMLFCEIYLANRQPMKAFNLLKQTNILCTYRGKWKVCNNEKDDDIRAQVVTILLDMFCDTSPEYAFPLFELLIVDQSSNFYPIDLSYLANKLVSSLLLRNDHELIIDIAKLIDNYDCTLYPITYRALISSLVRIDLPLAKQMYQSVVLLGIYPEMQLHPIMYIIVKSDWTSEEMYLAIWAMMHKLVENLGHAIEGVKQHLSFYLVFEPTPSDKQLVNNRGTNEQYENEIIRSVNLMKKVLKTEFHPPLSLVNRRKGKLQKISCTSLYKYLKSNQMNCM
ncbi:uncharacterized protein LOC143215826 [Lasioglossum baleicum]|uniref:uncharacterized protein LOC143215826 n=1 Tax=Lasioglossum baleicum TaxID=434251 RepID=UPI003FCDAE53